jgi:hypothetical protein
MEYWDGSTWVIIPAPNSAKGSLEFCNGVTGWNVKSTCISPNTMVRSIGDNGPAGGKVFYVTHAGLHGLEAAPADQSSGAEWGCYVNAISGAQGTTVGTGAANTTAIVTDCAEAGTAAKIADAYALNGYTDWFLPSKDELNLLYQQKSVVGGFAVNYYWSSSEGTGYHAWAQYFDDGNKSYGNKNNTLPVRAVRAF